ncbi:helix-turn-helix transcriptional regulator [Klebsiella variicola]|uniref:helix-turn-helix transcriptional regulator n=1 Tax=Klebsiella variicola TaxID=244366 RepID=UPI003D9A0436
MDTSRHQLRRSFAQDLQRLFPGLTVKYTDYYYRLTNRFTQEDLIVLLLQAPLTELTLHRMMALRRRMPSPVLFAALMDPKNEGTRWFARILGCESVNVGNSFTHIALTLNAFITGGIEPVDCPLSSLTEAEWISLKLAMCGMGLEEMARIHGVSVSGARQRVRHALDKLGMPGRVVPCNLLAPVTCNPDSHLTLMELSAAGLNDAGFPDVPELSAQDHLQDRGRLQGMTAGIF